MAPTRQGSIRLFRLWGIDVYLHFSWFLVAVYSISTRIPNYASPVWGALEYLALFLIVLMHEFGHALACRQVGGSADQIVLWPLGGVAYVSPPARPGATLWSIVAGPLVNVVLYPVLMGILFLSRQSGWSQQVPDLDVFLRAVVFVNVLLLVFNLLPVYPLDGGQILRSLLWYPLGKARSLLIATLIGFAGGLSLLGFAIWSRSIWIGIMAAFLLSYCWRSFQEARGLRQLERLPRREGYLCPSCAAPAPLGAFWRCRKCEQPFDLFVGGGYCPKCNASHTAARCIECGSENAISSWENRDRIVI